MAQILDDSSRQIYSIRTVLIRQEKEMESNRGRISPDTLLPGFSDKLDFLIRNGRIFQNLGTFASASRPLLFELPSSIGKRNGMQAFDALIPGREGVPYFHTLSPFTSIRYMQGARQRAMLQANFSVNPLSGWNLSAGYQRLTALRVLNVTSQDERETDHHSLWISSNFSSRNGRYRAWGHYRHLNHLQYITGGAVPGATGFSDSIFTNPEIMKAKLFRDARNRDLRNDWYFSQVLKLKGKWYFRSIHLREKQLTRYGDSRPDSSYYGRDHFYFQDAGPSSGEPDSLFVQRIFEVYEHSAGIGLQDTSSSFFLFAKRRDWNFRNFFLPGSRSGADLIFGINWDGNAGKLRHHFSLEWRDAGEYDFKGRMQWKGLVADGRFFSFRPSMVQETFQSRNLFYERNFQSSRAVQLRLSALLPMGGIRIRPRMEWMQVSSGIAFDSSFRPFQATGISSFLYPGLDLETNIGKRIHSASSFTIPFQGGQRIAGMPQYILSSSHWADLVKNRKSIAAQIGFTIDWRARWVSEMFAAPNAQWYVQTKEKIPSYIAFTAFSHVRIDRVRVYFRVHNVLQGLNAPGFFAAPGYPSQRRLFELGLDWTFFD